ncbi:pyrroline-5-carboxylate reductase [Paenibacillus daejeonensis]|uniref:pyrroline-5-carboxylate reductase n=1 Tax=Paenibacillus daejeonensis TaxID=135193 RepID=UPI00035DEBF1|nr:pyrroline-5-carboxylate reductase [Paenibacillus daejeonensis]
MSQYESPAIEITGRKIAFYGSGSMAEAIAKGMLDRRLTTPDQLIMINRSNEARLEELRGRYGVVTPTTEDDKLTQLHEADIIFLAVKPKDAQEAILKLRNTVRSGQMVISVIAGLSILTMEQLLDKPVSIVRTMPNTSSTIGLGATGISFSEKVTQAQQDIAIEIFHSLGITIVVEEPLLDTVTGLSGTGPAYIYYMMEAMIQAGHALGLEEADARKLTVQTVLGAARMVQITGEEPADLRRKVTSPGGTTQAAIETLEQHRFTDSVVKAVSRATQRAGELGAMIERSTIK